MTEHVILYFLILVCLSCRFESRLGPSKDPSNKGEPSKGESSKTCFPKEEPCLTYVDDKATNRT